MFENNVASGLDRVAEPALRKGERTRARLVQTALRLFTERGYEATTLRDIAAEAGTAVGLTYRYFRRKEDLVLAIYDRLAAELEEEVAALPPAPLSVRVGQALEADLRRILPYWDALSALYAAGLSRESELAVLGPGTGGIRTRASNAFRTALLGATDSPPPHQVEDLVVVLYAAHLSLILFALQDRTEGHRATHALIAFGVDILGRLRPLLRLPATARSLRRLAGILMPVFAPESVTDVVASYE